MFDAIERKYKNAAREFIWQYFFDGAGEAKIDLLPGSHFLTELNTRPHP